MWQLIEWVGNAIQWVIEPYGIIFGCTIQLFSMLIFYTCKCIFERGYNAQLRRCIPQEGGWDRGVGRSSSIKPNSTILIENFLAGKAQWKKIANDYVQFGDLFHHKNYVS